MLATMQNPAVLAVAYLHEAFTRLYLYGIGVRIPCFVLYLKWQIVNLPDLHI